MPAVGETVRVEGFRELQRAFKLAGGDLQTKLRVRLREVAEPVRETAEALAVEEITRIGVPWSRMRVGFTTTSVYVAPQQRGRLSRRNPALKRPNLAGLLLHDALEPSLERNVTGVTHGLEGLLEEIGTDWERA